MVSLGQYTAGCVPQAVCSRQYTAGSVVPAPPFVVEQYVVALQVTMHDGRRLRVQVGHRVGDLARHRFRLGVRV